MPPSVVTASGGARRGIRGLIVRRRAKTLSVPPAARVPQSAFGHADIARFLGAPRANIDTYWPQVVRFLVRDEIDDRPTQIAALATIGVEAGTFAPVHEAYWLGEAERNAYYTRMYDINGDRPRVARELGNSEPGDGIRYHGRGFIQVTGRFNYRAYGRELDVPLEDQPDEAVHPEVAAAVLARYFRLRSIPQAARAGDWQLVRRRVNGGLNGYDRFYGYVKAFEAIQGGAPVPTYVFPVEGYPKGKIPLHWNVSPRAADLFAAKGAKVRAMVSGRIEDASWNDVGGWSIYMIGDADTKGLHYYMAHLRDQPLVQAGDRVTAGQHLGYVGDSGNAAGKGAHLHIGIGHGIQNGSGPEGGAGINYDANAYLQRILDGVGSGTVEPTPDPKPAPDPKQAPDSELAQLRERVAQLETALAHMCDVVAGDQARAIADEAQRIREEFLGKRRQPAAAARSRRAPRRR